MSPYRLACLLAAPVLVTACQTTAPYGSWQSVSTPPDHCVPPAGVNWNRTLDDRFTETVAQSHAATGHSRGWPEASMQTGDDVIIRLYRPSNLTTEARLERRDGAWHMEMRTAAAAPPMRQPPAPFESARFTCPPAHQRRGGPVSPQDAAQLDAWVDDACREAEPGFIPSVVFLNGGGVDDCLDGATTLMQVETSAGITRYTHSCEPRLSAGAIMDLITTMQPVENAPEPALPEIEIEWRGGPSFAEACRREAEARGIDTTDPWAW